MQNGTIPKTMKAAQYHAQSNSCQINEIPVPEIKPYELLVKTICSSLCRSDLMNFEPDTLGIKPTDPDTPPITLGHEAAGRIVSIGSECTTGNFKVGDEVGFLPSANVCFDCEACLVHPMWCESYEGGCKNPGHSYDGYFSEYIAVHHRNAIVLPKGLPAVEAAPLFCAGVTSYHGIADLGLPDGSWVAIVGCGGLGHLGIQYAKAKKYKVIALDVSDSQLEEALSCGALHTFNAKTYSSYVSKIKDITNGGCDAVVNYTSSKASYDQCPKVLRPDGILMVVGHPTEHLTFSTIDIALRRFRIYGASNSTSRNLKECIDFSVEHGVKSHTTYYKRLEDIHEMIDLMQKGKARGRLAIQFE